MLGSAKVGAFLCTRDRARAKRFFTETLGLPLVHEDDFALVFDANGITLRISPFEGLTPQPFTVLGWEVPDVVAAITKLTAAGVTFERFPGMEQDGLGIWTPPGSTTKIAWFKDPDGNVLSLAQHK